jgi:NAD(P)-dependent dehydrogenase (short-subunit alcohol dehydrogenase family)
MDQYKKSKFFNVLFTVELKRKMEKYPNIKTFSLHPGVVATDFVQDVGYLKCFYALACCCTANPEDGARTSIYLATEDFNKLQNGEYYDSNTKHVEMDKRARDPVLGEKLWKISE